MEIEKEYSNVWKHNSPSDASRLIYWRLTFQDAHKFKVSRGLEVYPIRNQKARNALSCDACKKPAAYAIFDELRLCCDDHLSVSVGE